MPDFLETGPSIAKILRFYDFPNDRHRHLVFLKSRNRLTGCGGSVHINMPNFVKIGQLVAKILRFFDFSRWRPSAILDLFGAYVSTWGSLSLCKIWLWSMQ